MMGGLGVSLLGVRTGILGVQEEYWEYKRNTGNTRGILGIQEEYKRNTGNTGIHGITRNTGNNSGNTGITREYGNIGNLVQENS